MKTTRLAFNELHENLEVLDRINLSVHKGGQANTYEYTLLGDQLFWRISGTETWNNVNSLNQVEIVGHRAQPNFVYDENPFGFGGGWGMVGGGSSGGGGSGGSSGGSGGTGSNLWSVSALLGYTGMVFEKNARLLHFTATEASSLSDIANGLRATKVMVIATKSLGAIGSIATGFEGAFDSNGFTWGDGLRVGIGLIATFTPFGWAYAVVDLGTGIITGTTLTDSLGNALDEQIYE